MSNTNRVIGIFIAVQCVSWIQKGQLSLGMFQRNWGRVFVWKWYTTHSPWMSRVPFLDFKRSQNPYTWEIPSGITIINMPTVVTHQEIPMDVDTTCSGGKVSVMIMTSLPFEAIITHQPIQNGTIKLCYCGNNPSALVTAVVRDS